MQELVTLTPALTWRGSFDGAFLGEEGGVCVSRIVVVGLGGGPGYVVLSRRFPISDPTDNTDISSARLRLLRGRPGKKACRDESIGKIEPYHRPFLG